MTAARSMCADAPLITDEAARATMVANASDELRSFMIGLFRLLSAGRACRSSAHDPYRAWRVRACRRDLSLAWPGEHSAPPEPATEVPPLIAGVVSEASRIAGICLLDWAARRLSISPNAHFIWARAVTDTAHRAARIPVSASDALRNFMKDLLCPSAGRACGWRARRHAGSPWLGSAAGSAGTGHAASCSTCGQHRRTCGRRSSLCHRHRLGANHHGSAVGLSLSRVRSSTPSQKGGGYGDGCRAEHGLLPFRLYVQGATHTG
jgi:hypothetical protein